MNISCLSIRNILATLALLSAATAGAAESTDRIIVKWRATATDAALSSTRLRSLANRTSRRLLDERGIGPALSVIRLDNPQSATQLATTLAALRRDPAVQYAEPDRRVRAHAYTPTDPLFIQQWYLKSVQPAAARFDAAWEITRAGSSPVNAQVVIAVLDTGVRFEHPDLRSAASGGKLLPGYDFVSGDSNGSFATANDGNGWDVDASDPGDFINQTDLDSTIFAGRECGGGDNADIPTRSTWHGTRVAGMIAADSDNLDGITGAAFHARILPVRVLGKCGGYDSDIIAAMYWSAGLLVPPPLLSGTIPPINANPAQIINMSLGAVSTCNAAYADAVRDVTAHGVLIVASAGNEGGGVDAPGNCPGALAVGGLRHIGTKVGFSSLGPEVGISAPAGNCVNPAPGACLFSLDTTTNDGTAAPGNSTYTDQFHYNVGTSFSAPQAAAAAGLMKAVNPTLTPAMLIARIRESARPFPQASDSVPTPTACQLPRTDLVQESECLCTTQTCGAGMLDAAGAVSAALRPAALAQLNGTVGRDSILMLDASASAVAIGRTVASLAWRVQSIPVGAATPTLTSANTFRATLTSPSVGGSYVFRFTITDNMGASDSADITLAATANSGSSGSTSPPPATDNGGGGGALSWLALALLAAMLFRHQFHRTS
jgi:serine protease